VKIDIMTRIVTSDPAARPDPHPRAAWGLWALALAATLVLALVTTGLVLWGDATTCADPAAPANRGAGLRHLGLAAGVLAAAWLLVAALRRSHWPRYVLGAVLGIAPLLLAIATHRHVQDWVGYSASESRTKWGGAPGRC
jgi:hypothetical protein